MGGGAERVAAKIGSELFDRGYDIHYMTFYDNKNNYLFKGNHYCLNEDVKADPISKGTKLLLRAKKIAQYCNYNEIDTCIGFMEASNIPLVASRKIFKNKSRIIISVHDDPDNILKGNIIERYIIKKAYFGADLVVGVSLKIEQKLRGHGLRNIKTIYNINDIKEFSDLSHSPLPKNILSIKKSNYVFISIGRLVDQKNHASLIKAFNEIPLKKKFLILIGRGENEVFLRDLVSKLKLGRKVLILTDVDNVYPYLKHSDCFVLSSRHEGFGLVIVEALSLNIPVISTDCEVGPRELLAPEVSFEKKLKYPYYGKYGILIKPFDNQGHYRIQEEQLKEAMTQIMKDNLLRRRYSKGLKRARDFDIKEIIGEWERVI